MQTLIGIFAKHVSRSTPETLFDALAGFGLHCAQFNAACLGIPTLPDQLDAALWRRVARAILGTDLLTLCSGTRNQQDMWTYHPQNQSPEAWQEMIDAMQQGLEIAVDYDVYFGIEPEVANVVSNATDATRLINELRSNRIRIVFDPANLYRPPSDPRQDQHVITDALRLLRDRIAIAHCKDVADPAAQQDDERLYAHVAAGTGILDYHHYLSELNRLVPGRIPLILHGLSEEQIPDSVSFIQKRLNEIGTTPKKANG